MYTVFIVVAAIYVFLLILTAFKEDIKYLGKPLMPNNAAALEQKKLSGKLNLRKRKKLTKINDE